MRRRDWARRCLCPSFEALEPRLLMSGNALIVTNEALAPAFQDVADWYTRKGYAAEVVTTSSIYAQYAGRDPQEQIRECIRDYHYNKGVDVVLLGGDNTVVPDRDAYVSVGFYVERSMPTDLYYSALEGTWDSDGDNVFGEAVQDTDVDLTYDVILARYPVRTAEQVGILLDKVIAYETTPAGDGWATSMLATGDRLWNEYAAGTYNGIEFDHAASDAEIKSYAADASYVSPYWSERQLDVLFDTYTSWDSSAPGDYAMSSSNLISAMSNGYQFMHMATHGNYNIWGMESGYLTSYTIENMQTSVNAAIVSTIACMTGGYDMADSSLSEAFLRSPDTGTVAYLGCSRYGWGYASYILGPSFRYSYQFYKEFLANGHRLAGEAFAESKEAFEYACSYNGAYRWVQFGLNYQGDPLIQMYRNDPIQLDPTYDASIVSGSQDYVISNLPTGARVVLWQGDDLYEIGQADSTGTFTATIAPTDGVMQLTVVAEDAAVYTADVEITATPTAPDPDPDPDVDPDPGPDADLTTPAEFVRSLYRMLLAREADSSGLAFWVGKINSGLMTRDQVEGLFRGCLEHQVWVAPVRRLYLGYLGREGDAAGLNFWVNRYKAGMSLGSISLAFGSCSEFTARNGNALSALSDGEFVSWLYQNILQRQADQGGFTYWTMRLRTDLTRGDLMAMFTECLEYRTMVA